MKFINYLPIILLTFFSLKILISYIAKSTESLKEKSIKKQIENGILSIKDIQKNNYTGFIKVINIYFFVFKSVLRNINAPIEIPGQASVAEPFTDIPF